MILEEINGLNNLEVTLIELLVETILMLILEKHLILLEIGVEVF
jgi:hypothetical protein